MQFKDYQKSIENHFRENGYVIDPIPKVDFIYTDNDPFDPFIDTGNFNASENKITLYVGNRQLKDILRTYCHELVHVHQFHIKPEEYKKANTDLSNENTKDIESEAYSLGNIMLRSWTDKHKNDQDFLKETAEKPFKDTVAIICAAMRPPHKGHLELIQEYLKTAQKIIVILSNPQTKASQRKTIDGKSISAQTSKKILEEYLKKYGISDKVEIIISNEPSPIKCAASYINSDLTNVSIILGMSKKEDPYSRYSGIKEYFKDRDDIYIYDPKSTAVEPKSKVSATEIRDHINDFDYIKDMFPDKLSDEEKKNLITLITGNEETKLEESKLGKQLVWYVGNNRSKNFKLSPPTWIYPFYLSENKEYAEEYSDYGVYKVTIKNGLDILDFSKDEDINKLDIPDILKEAFKKSDSDLNNYCADLFKLLRLNGKEPDFDHDILYLDKEKIDQWIECAKELKSKCLAKTPFNKEFHDSASKIKQRLGELVGDELFLIYIYYLIYKAGFSGFIRKEFNHKVLGILNIDSLDRISLKPIS